MAENKRGRIEGGWPKIKRGRKLKGLKIKGSKVAIQQITGSDNLLGDKSKNVCNCDILYKMNWAAY